MSALVYFNGQLIPESEALLPINDRSYLYGEGLFETMRANRGFIPFLPEHLKRLERGLQLVGLNLDLSAAKIEFAVYQTLFHNDLKDAYIRLTVSGKGEGARIPSEALETNVLVVVRDLPKIPEEQYQKGISAKIIHQYPMVPDTLSAIKATNYLAYLLAKQAARGAGFEEGLILNTQGRLVEGASSNLFVFDGGQWVTPPLSEGALAGVTRQVLLGILAKNKIPYLEAPLEIDQLKVAKEAFLCNAIQEILPLTRVEDYPIAPGELGPETQQLQRLFQEEVQFRFEKFQSRRWGVKETV